MKKCPYCAEEIQDDAIKCKYCREHLSGQENIERQEQAPAKKPPIFDVIIIGILLSIFIGVSLFFVYKYKDWKNHNQSNGMNFTDIANQQTDIDSHFYAVLIERILYGSQEVLEKRIVQCPDKNSCESKLKALTSVKDENLISANCLRDNGVFHKCFNLKAISEWYIVLKEENYYPEVNILEFKDLATKEFCESKGVNQAFITKGFVEGIEQSLKENGQKLDITIVSPDGKYYTLDSMIKTANEAFNNGDEYFKNGKYDQAISEYTKVIELSPSDAAYNNRGNSYSRKGSFDPAISDFSKAIEINSKNAVAYTNRGLAYFGKNNYDKAIMDLTKVIEINPNDPAAYSGRSYVYLTKKDYNKAILDFDKVSELNPKDTNVYLVMSNAFNHEADGLYRKGERLEEGVKLINKALEKSPYNAVYLSTKAELFYKLGRYNDAYEYIMRAIKLEPNRSEIQNDVKMIEQALNKSKDKSSR